MIADAMFDLCPLWYPAALILIGAWALSAGRRAQARLDADKARRPHVSPGPEEWS